MNILFLLIGCALAVPVLYLYVIAFASVRVRVTLPSAQPRHRFAIAIPAHNEESVIARTVNTLRELNYPRDWFDIFVVADYCSDHTAAQARAAGAICWERNEGSRGGKGAALAWLFQRIFSGAQTYDAAVVFDADTRVDAFFLRVMDARMQQGALTVQGCHRIINPEDAWFAALTWAMFIVDNRFQNLGRSNLGWSAKNMGDSICFRADILRTLGWGEGLTEDYEFRQRLLLQGVRIQYEPAAIGYGEAPTSWQTARMQRARWLSGTFRASRRYAWEMFQAGLRRRDTALLDGVAQATLPSYSTLTLLAIVGLLIQVPFSNGVISTAILFWLGLVLMLGAYPLFGLVLEHAPMRAYFAIWLGPVFMVWRTVLSISARFGRRQVVWVRTARRNEEKIAELKK
jgi:cellulose synthase/poly-beta-1,6-N-acetylglucosamine synthase-like glycosyltransferase